jgi:hypothetical protein
MTSQPVKRVNVVSASNKAAVANSIKPPVKATTAFSLPKAKTVSASTPKLPMSAEQRSAASRTAAEHAWGKMRTALWQHDHAQAIVSQIDGLRTSDKAKFEELKVVRQEYIDVITKTRVDAEKQRQMTPAQYEAIIQANITAKQQPAAIAKPATAAKPASKPVAKRKAA